MQYETDEYKKELLRSQMFSFIECVIRDAAMQDKLDYVNIEILNHNGNLQMDYTLRDRKKAY